ncbi:MAG: SecD/SecF fusion protein [Actinomycetota bacterium]|nr:SecD/SecF fusion protein [Actinomycetota bacterium]
MNRTSLVRALLALTVLALSAFFTVTTSPRLGIDLRGGTQIVLETHDSPTTKADRRSTDRALEVLRRRVDALGVSEPSIARSGDRRIVVELPGLQDPAEASKVIGQTAQLTFHPVLDTTTGSTVDESGQPLDLGPTALTGEGVKDASAALDAQFGTSRYVGIDFTGKGDRAWTKLTADAACAAPGDPRRRIAIVLDGDVISSPQVDPSVRCGVGIVGGRTQITGSFSAKQADDLAALIKGGALPVPVTVIEQRTVGATLGADAIASSLKAGVIGIALTAAFLVIVYRLVGLIAAVALASYGLISYGTLVALGATLTLPGLAGLLLSAGLAIDANVLVFERAREEYAGGHRRGLRGALETGYRKAWSAIADSNATTLLAAGLLFMLAAGPVRGFGVTLCIGVLASMVSALVVCRSLTDFALARGAVVRRPRLSGLASLGRFREAIVRRRPDLMRYRRRWLGISLVAVILATSGIVVRGLQYGVEFTGGRSVEYSTSQPVSVAQARQAVADAGFPRAIVQQSGKADITVRTSPITDAQQTTIQHALERDGGTVTKQRDDLIGPTLGKELRNKAILALGIALAVQLAYLALRFRWSFGAAAVLAMLHDVLIVVGLFAWLGKSIDGVFLAAALTIIGVSVNDSIVTLDRIRETWSQRRKEPLAAVANDAILQTAPRTLNTGIGAMFILAALTFLGGSSLTDFALALLIGLVVGTYSSAFTATPLLLAFEARSSSPPPMPKRSQTRRAAGPARVPQDSGAVL